MLKYKLKRCPCHAGMTVERVYNWHGYGYCLTCLHSIGINAAGNYCSDRQYRDAWENLATGCSSSKMTQLLQNDREVA